MFYDRCKISKEYEKWDKKNESVWDKREVHMSKCILNHAKNSSSVPFEEIRNSCWVLAADKYKTKGKEPEKYICKE